MNEETTTILIDTALASGSASALDPEERKLQELVLTIRDDAPSPDPDFALRMNARVAAGFPRRRGTGLRLPTFMTTRPQLAAIGVAASLLIALVVAIGIGSGGSNEGTPTVARIPAQSTAGSGSAAGGATAQAVPKSAPNSTREAAPTAKVAPSAGAPALSSSDAVVGPVPPQPPTNGFVGGGNRKVERSAALVLAPAKDKVSEVGNQVVAVTDRYHGIVMRSSVTSTPDEAGGGSFDLRIPVRNLQPALRDLSGLADVASRTENSDDVTASFVTARTQLQELTAERRSLLRRLAKADTDAAAAAIRSQIRDVNAQIQAAMTGLKALQRRTSYATVSVTLQAKQGGSGGGGGGIGKGARDLRDSLVDAANIALRVLGVALPIAILLGLLWAGGGWFSRRRREAVLD